VLLDHHPFGRSPSGKAPKRKFGGLADLVLTINSLVVGGLMFTIGFSLVKPAWVGVPFQIAIACVAGLVASAVAFALQYNFAHPREQFSHAGGVVYQLEAKKAEYLLVGPKLKDEGKKEWLLPKGHLEKELGETAAAAALREVEEETGVKARIIAPLGVVSFFVEDKPVRVMFYLMEKLRHAGIKRDERDMKWFTFEDAVRNASHSETQRMLCLAEATRLDQH
jgi:ADP-ribose pyrophosphatase YjhB (NUDIX family)